MILITLIWDPSSQLKAFSGWSCSNLILTRFPRAKNLNPTTINCNKNGEIAIKIAKKMSPMTINCNIATLHKIEKEGTLQISLL